MKTYFVIIFTLYIQNYCFGQTAINTVSTVSTIVVSGGTSSQVVNSNASSVNGILPGTNYTVRYNNNGNVNITDFTLSGNTYVRYSNFDTVIIRRVANAWETTGGNKQHLYCQGAAIVDNVTFQMPFPVAYPVVTNHSYMERVMKQGYINRGSDNVFNNSSVSDLTFNNIERVDFVYKTGIATASITIAGFLIAERGGNDPFKIAAITGIDANGNPTSFGAVLSVGAASYGNAITSFPTYVMRKDPADIVLRPFSLVPSQAVKATFIKLSDLGIVSMQRVYGYALMASDVTATTSAQLLSFTNSTYFPRTTTIATGGIDLASAPGIFHTNQVLAGEYISLNSQNKNGEQVLQWTDNDFIQTKEYRLEKSLDRENFEELAVIRTAAQTNSFTDKNFTLTCYYRLKVVLLTGETYYSSIVAATGNSLSGKATLYPNPVKEQLTVSYTKDMHIDKLSIISFSGKEVGSWKVNANNQQVILDMSALPQGQYYIKLSGVNGVQKTYPVIKL